MSNYAFRDIIFVPRVTTHPLSDEFVRVRVYIRNNWPTKKVVLERKHAEFKEIGKTDTILLKREFDTEQKAVAFIKREIGAQFERGFEYEREGWQYDLGTLRIFVEDIKGYTPTLEVEAETNDEIVSVFDRIGIVEILHASLPELMRNVLEH